MTTVQNNIAVVPTFLSPASASSSPFPYQKGGNTPLPGRPVETTQPQPQQPMIMSSPVTPKAPTFMESIQSFVQNAFQPRQNDVMNPSLISPLQQRPSQQSPLQQSPSQQSPSQQSPERKEEEEVVIDKWNEETDGPLPKIQVPLDPAKIFNADMIDEIAPQLEEYYEALDHYLELEEKASREYIQDKQQLIYENRGGGGGGKKNIKRLLKAMPRRCVNCRQSPHPQFSYKQNTYKVVCNNPGCGLNIELFAGKFDRLDEFSARLLGFIEKYKTAIIQNKTDNMFNFKSDADTYREFVANVNEMNLIMSAYIKAKEMQLLIEDDPERKVEIEERTKECRDKIMNLKQQMIRTDAPYQQLVHDSISMYKSDILPAILRLRELKYPVYELEYSNTTNEWRLLQATFLKRGLEIPKNFDMDNLPRIIHNDYRKPYSSSSSSSLSLLRKEKK